VTRLAISPRELRTDGEQADVYVRARPNWDEVVCLDRSKSHRLDFNANQRNADGRESCYIGDVEWRVFGSVSSMNALAARAIPGAEHGFPGQQVVFYSSLLSPAFALDTRLPAVLYFNATVMTLPKADYERFCDVLEAAYPEGHRCWFYGRTFNMAPEDLALVRGSLFNELAPADWVMSQGAVDGAASRIARRRAAYI
jgi:hypothetical protein